MLTCLYCASTVHGALQRIAGPCSEELTIQDDRHLWELCSVS